MKRDCCLDSLKPCMQSFQQWKGALQCKMEFSPQLIFNFIQSLCCLMISKVSKSCSVCEPQWVFRHAYRCVGQHSAAWETAITGNMSNRHRNHRAAAWNSSAAIIQLSIIPKELLLFSSDLHLEKSGAYHCLQGRKLPYHVLSPVKTPL